jgi:serine/threonine protein kinase/tetratricopeptide (TPR) repeat protein
MEIERWHQIETLFYSALEIEMSEREEFLRRVCEGDTELFQEVQSLLVAHEQPGSFMGNSAFGLGMQMLKDEQTNLQSSTLGHYKIIKPIGSGGMGQVFLAEDPRLSRRVAIKLLPRSFLEDPSRIYRFQQEARAASAISHPNIAHIYETGVEAGYHFTSMEFIDGITLRKLMDQRRLELKEAVNIALQVGSALVAAHTSGVIHRDIKPENIMIHRDGYIKVLDFGLAKLTDRMSDHWNATTIIDPVETQPGMVMGSPAYMSPEQARGLEVDARTDIWSLGIVLYEMVTGWTPFHGATNMDVLAGVLKEEPTPIIEYIDNVPPGLKKVLQKMLSKNKDERYLSSSDMITELKKLARSLQSNSDAILDYETRIPLRSNIRRHKQRTMGILKAWISLIVVNPIRNARGKKGITRILALRYVFALFVAAITLGLAVTWSIDRLSRTSIHKPGPAALAEYKKGVNAIFANDLYKANEALDRAIRLDNQFAVAHVRSANVLKDLEQTSGSMGEFETAKDMVMEIRAVGYETLIRNDNPLSLDEIDRLYFSALSESQQGNYDVAAETFSQISALTPDRPEIYLDLGFAHERNGDFERATSSYLKATMLDPESAVGFLRLAIARGKKGDFSAAKAAFDRADYLYRTTAENGSDGQLEILYQRSDLLRRLNRIREARNYGEQALQLAVSSGNSVQTIRCFFLLACILYAEGKQDGVEYERQALSLAETTHHEELVPRGLIEIGETFRSKQELSEARSRFQTALARAQSADLIHSRANALYALGQLQLQEKNPDESNPLFAEVLRIEFPNRFFSRDAQVHWRNLISNTDYQTAIRMFKKKFFKFP